MSYLLDTNAVIALLNGQEKFLKKISQYHEKDFIISSIVLFELYFGANNSQRIEQNIQKIELLPFDVLEFNKDDAKIAGKIRAELKQKGTPIGEYDLLIASQAIRTNKILITHNVKEFARISTLNYEDWL